MVPLTWTRVIAEPKRKYYHKTETIIAATHRWAIQRCMRAMNKNLRDRRTLYRKKTPLNTVNSESNYTYFRCQHGSKATGLELVKIWLYSVFCC